MQPDDRPVKKSDWVNRLTVTTNDLRCTWRVGDMERHEFELADGLHGVRVRFNCPTNQLEYVCRYVLSALSEIRDGGMPR